MKFEYKGALFTFIGDNGKKYDVTITTPTDSKIIDRKHSVIIYEDGIKIHSAHPKYGHANKTMALRALKLLK